MRERDARLAVGLLCLAPSCAVIEFGGPTGSSGSGGLGGTAAGDAGGGGATANVGAGGTGGDPGPTARALTIGNENDDRMLAAAVDDNGSIAIAAELTGLVEIGATTIDSGTDSEISVYVAVLDADLELVWSRVLMQSARRTVGADALSSNVAMAFDVDGNLVVGGTYVEDITFDGIESFVVTPPDAGYPNAFIARFAPDGTSIHGEAFDLPNSQLGVSVATDGANGDVLYGAFNYSLDLGGDCAALSAAGAFDLFVAGFDETGKCRRIVTFGGAGTENATTLSVGENSDLVLTGQFQDMVTFGDYTVSASPAGGAGSDIFVARLDKNFSPLFATDVGSASAQGYDPVFAFPAGDSTIFSGGMQPPLAIGGGQGFGGRDFVVTKLSSTGLPAEVQIAGGRGDEGARAMALPGGGFRAYGTFVGSTNIGRAIVANGDSQDIVVAELAENLAPTSAEAVGGPGAEQLVAVGYFADQEVLIGQFTESFTLQGVTLVAAGSSDAFIIVRELR